MSARPSDQLVASELIAARREGRGLSGFPGTVPATMAEAYRIQDAAISSWPDAVVGWKIGYIVADRRRAGEPDRLVGPIWQQSCYRGEQGSAVEVGIFAAGFAAVEAELVIRLGTDLPDPGHVWTSAEAASLDQELWFGIEVASSPIAGINSLGPTVIAADFGNNNGLVLGAPVTDGGGAAATQLTCSIDGALVGTGSGDTLPGGIHHGLATALNVLGERGQPVPAGTLFATGAITGIHPIGPDQHCRVDVTGGRSIELRTVDAARQV